jgi:signal transduction histidine kinase
VRDDNLRMLASAAAPGHPPELEALVRADLANAVQRNVAGLILGNVLVVGMVAWLFWAPVPSPVLLGWVGLQLLHSGLSLWRSLRLRLRPANPRNAARRLRVTSGGMAFAGLLWGAGVVALWPLGDSTLQVVLLLLAVGSAAGALNALVGWLPACYGFVVLCTGGIMAATLLDGSPALRLFGLAAPLVVAVNMMFARQMHDTLREALRNRRLVSDLAARLDLEKQRAEEANQAKSRFLAAASHDLRQPVHALTLFVDALAAQPSGPEAEHMLARISATVAGMGGMFNALLDVSKLDAGMVVAEAQTIELRTLLERLCAEQTTVAAQRGLRLRLNAHEVRVHTDPLLLERIVRNLLVNALRYTDRGGVLVTARQRRGWAVVRVADSGIGIAPQRQDEVFEEFVQLHNPQRDRNQGLGLGLAIVRRLARLLDIDLSLRSRPGHGSVFTLRLPAADATELGAPMPAWVPSAAVTGEGALVVVIDDDADIRAGMRALLAADGYRVLDAAGFDEVRPQLRPLRQVPVLIISDYRLRDGATGAAAIERLRVEFNEDIPAILITGDAAPERLREAIASGHLLLHKPVPPQLLRQKMATLLAAPAAGG